MSLGHLIRSPIPHGQVSASASLTSSPHLASRLDLVWFMCIMVCFVPSPPTISFTQPNHPDRSQTVHCSHQVLTLHQQWTWLGLCAPWLIPSPPTILFTHPNHPDRSQTVHCLHQVITLHQQWTWLGLCAPWLIPSPPTISFIHPNHPDRS